MKAATKSAASKIRLLQSRSLGGRDWLVHGFSTRAGGSSTCYGGRTLNLGLTKEDRPETVERNRRRLLLAVGAHQGGKPWPLVTLKQIHSDLIHVVRSRTPTRLTGDGLVTNIPEVMLAVQTADCFPVMLVDTKNRAVGAFHAGWRGTVQRIVEKGVGVMRQEYGTRPEDILAVIGPGIQKCCYEIGDEVKAQFESQFAYSRELFHELYSPDPIRTKYPLLFLNVRPPGHGDTSTKLYLDIAEANRRQLLTSGVPEDGITVMQHCTSCKTRNTRRFFSHRAERGLTGRMMAIIGIRR